MKTIGIVGGGQLARMLTLAALPLGFSVVVVDPTENCPAAQVGAKQIIGNFYDKKALQELATQVDYITIEIEHIDTAELENLAHLKPVNPAPSTINLMQDKLKQKQFLQSHNIPVAPFAEITSTDQAKKLLEDFKNKMLIKTRRGAYDGRGNMVVKNNQDLQTALATFKGQPLYGEMFIPFKKELAVMVARDMAAKISTYPVVETIHKRNICVEVLAPASISQTEEKAALRIAKKAAKHLRGAGVFGIELFLTANGQVLVNEIAPRVHNSGHYTIEACMTSQFEQHIRVISGLPLDSTQLISNAAVMVNILGERNGPTHVRGLDRALATPHTKVHLYGKSPTKVDRKMGHITALGNTLPQAQKRAQHVRKLINI